MEREKLHPPFGSSLTDLSTFSRAKRGDFECPEKHSHSFKKLHDRSIDLLSGVVFDKRPKRDGYCLYASMIELCGGILVLVERDRKTAVSPVFRTLLEAYVDLRNALQDPAYVEHTLARHHKDWIKVLSHGEKNPFLAGVIEHRDRDEALERHRQELEKLQRDGIRPLKPNERFKQAGMAEEYVSIYHFESDATHNSWQAMIARHFEKTEEDFELALYKRHTLDDYTTHLDSAASLLLDATERIHERFESAQKQEVGRLREEFDKVRTNMVDTPG